MPKITYKLIRKQKRKNRKLNTFNNVIDVERNKIAQLYGQFNVIFDFSAFKFFGSVSASITIDGKVNRVDCPRILPEHI